eukprot:2723144-Pyramimonas_sp.AAC.1
MSQCCSSAFAGCSIALFGATVSAPPCRDLLRSSMRSDARSDIHWRFFLAPWSGGDAAADCSARCETVMAFWINDSRRGRFLDVSTKSCK